MPEKDAMNKIYICYRIKVLFDFLRTTLHFHFLYLSWFPLGAQHIVSIGWYSFEMARIITITQ